jgi:hypothetical protein
MTVGTKGIFMPIKYDETVIRAENGTALAFIELAEYGFMDGERWAFLDKPNGIAFAQWAYSSILNYESVEGEPTMDEIRQYVRAMLERQE